MSEDKELLSSIANRDPEAFRTLMERHAVGVINVAFRFLGTMADAEDVAQDVFFRLYQKPPTLLPNTKLSTWLYRVTVNRCLDLLRGKSRRGETISLETTPAQGQEELPLQERLADPSAPSPRDRVVQAELATFARAAVAALPEVLRAPIVLSTFEENSHQEIARILRISPKAVERRLARARELLKARLTPYL